MHDTHDQHHTTLLALPDVLLRQVLGWSADHSTAKALLACCHTSRLLRQDPAAAALLLLRCPCRDYGAALASFTQCQGGTASVVQNVLQLLNAPPHSCSTFAPSARLLQAMLLWASANGQAASTRALLALPHPPDASAQSSQALQLALQAGPHIATAQALLEGGADPWRPHHLILFALAAQVPAWRASLHLHLQRCPAAEPHDAAAQALLAAVQTSDCAAVTQLLPAVVGQQPAAGGAGLVWEVALACDAGVLQLLLENLPAVPSELDLALHNAVHHGSTACAGVLLDLGAYVHHGGLGALLRKAVDGALGAAAAAAAAPAEAGRVRAAEQALGMVRLLLDNGAVVPPDALSAVHLAGGSVELLALLQ